jgi:phosphatidyl-myo-inositol dimannoside synthase
MEALKIGFLTSDLSHRHGWAHYSISLIRELQRVGVNVTVIATQNSPDVEGLNVHKLLPSSMAMGLKSLFSQRMLLPQVRALLQDCDLIHATIEPFAPLASWIAGDRPLFITGHGTYVRRWSDRPWPVNALYRRAFLRSKLVCVSRYTEKIARVTLPEVQTVLVNNGVDAERFIASPSQSVEKRGPTVLAVGAVKGRKGTLELVRAIDGVRREIPDVQCVVVGSLDLEPDYVAKVRAAVTELGLSDHVQLLGHVPEATLMAWYHAADVFAVPAMNDGWKFEGYGLIYLEAGAAGLPVIGTQDNGGEDAIDDGLTGLLISQAKVADELPKAIVRLLRDPELAARMGAAGREKALRQTWDHVAAKMLVLYNKL